MPHVRHVHYLYRGRLGRSRAFVIAVYDELVRTRAFDAAAALAFYCLLSLAPLFMVLSTLFSYLPIPGLFHRLLSMISVLTPAEELALVERIVAGAVVAHRGAVLSFGLLSYLWGATGGFRAAIEALDIAYDVQRGRGWWRNRLRAAVLMLTTGSLGFVSLLVLIVGPHFGRFLIEILPIPRSFALLWPPLRLVVTFATFVLAIVMLFYLGPNRKQSFLSTFPGAVVSVVGWSIGSFSLNFYFAHFGNYDKAYGSLGAIVVLMLWFYMVALAILVGAEANAELLKSLASRQSGDDNPSGHPLPGVPGLSRTRDTRELP